MEPASSQRARGRYRPVAPPTHQHQQGSHHTGGGRPHSSSLTTVQDDDEVTISPEEGRHISFDRHPSGDEEMYDDSDPAIALTRLTRGQQPSSTSSSSRHQQQQQQHHLPYPSSSLPPPASTLFNMRNLTLFLVLMMICLAIIMLLQATPPQMANDEIAAALDHAAEGGGGKGAIGDEEEKGKGCLASGSLPLWRIGDVPHALGTEEKDTPRLTAFIPHASQSSGVSMLIMPGGAYAFVAEEREGFQYARWLCKEHGIASYVLRYRLGPDGYHHPAEKEDGQRAMRLVRSLLRADVDNPQKVGVIGSSAGGHLAATISIYNDAGNPDADDPIETYSCRPDFTCLLYPVITFEHGVTHEPSKENILGPDVDKEQEAALTDYYSLEKHVQKTFPPTYLFHTKDDQAVPVENSLRMDAALTEAQVPHILRLVDHGKHGLGLWGENQPGTQLHPWTGWLIDFLYKQKILSPSS